MRVILAGLVVFVFGATVWASAGELDSGPEAFWRAAAREQADGETRQHVLQDSKLTTYLDDVLQRLWSRTSTELPRMRLRIVENNRRQAFTYPNGVCYLSTGMLVSLRCEDQLAMILAHEMVHYLNQHACRAWNHLHYDATDASPAPRLDPSEGNTRASMAFYLAMELEADAKGLKLIRGAGYCPGEVIPLLQTMAPPAGLSSDSAVRISHARLQAVQKIIGHADTSLACKGADGRDERQTTFDRGIASALVADSRLAIERGLWDRARGNLTRYCNVSQVDAELLFLKGEFLRRHPGSSGQTAALSAYAEAIELDHTFAPAYRALGLVNFKLGRKETARRYFEGFLALIPDGPDTLFIRDYLRQCTN